MTQQWLSVGKGCAAALMVVLATAGLGRAQSGAQPPDVPRAVNPYGQYPHAWRYYDYPSASVGAPLMNPPVFMTSINYPGVYGAFIYGPAGSFFPAPGPHTTGYQSNYGSAYAPLIPNDTRAHLTVLAPPTSKLWFNDTLTHQVGRFRQFVTPPLTPSEPFHYNITAKWVNRLGREVTQNRQVTVSAGQWLNVDLSTPPPPTAEMRQIAPPPVPQRQVPPPVPEPQAPPVSRPAQAEIHAGPLPGTAPSAQRTLPPAQRTVPRP